MIGRRWLQALPTALLVHAFTVMSGLSTVSPLARSVAPRVTAESSKSDALLVMLRLYSHFSDAPLRYAGVPLLTTLISAPLLLLLWLHAAERSDSISILAHVAASEYRRAVGVWAACLVYGACLLLLAAGLGLGVYRALDRIENARTQTYGAVIVTLPFLFALLHPLTLLDAASACIARGATSVSSALRMAWKLTSLRLILLRALFVLGSLSLLVLGLYVPRSLFGLSSAGNLPTLLLGQLCALLAVMLRGLWLALLIDAAISGADLRSLGSECRAPHAVGSTAPTR